MVPGRLHFGYFLLKSHKAHLVLHLHNFYWKYLEEIILQKFQWYLIDTNGFCYGL